ncbi:hypothetical protein WDV76_03850 [Xenorhabdus griffiniae]|uniref:hypothetical protein n=1 Tax=Xenorhabdus griffiniae TaxID=351672 RepID=UPI0030D150C3
MKKMMNIDKINISIDKLKRIDNINEKIHNLRNNFYRKMGDKAIDRMTEFSSVRDPSSGELGEKVDVRDAMSNNIEKFNKKDFFILQFDEKMQEESSEQEKLERKKLELSFSNNFRSKRFYISHATDSKEVINGTKLVLRSRFGIKKYNIDYDGRKKKD